MTQTKKYLLTSDTVVDNLTSTATDAPLSANQGKTLNDNATALSSSVTALAGRVTSLESGPTVYSGTYTHPAMDPSTASAKNGDIYVRYSE